MAWVRLEDTAPEHCKLLAAGPAACWLWVCGIAYCQRQLTDGFIPAAALPVLGIKAGAVKLARRLVDAGLFEVVNGGYQIHDYHDYNATREQAIERKTQTSEVRSRSGRIGGLRSGERRAAERHRPGRPHEAHGKQTVSNEEANGQQTTEAIAEAPRSPIPSHPIPKEQKEKNTRADAPHPIHAVFDRYQAAFLARYGAKPTFGGAKDGARMKQLLARVGLSTVLQRLDAFFISADPWIQRSGHTLDVFFASGTQTKLTVECSGHLNPASSPLSSAGQSTRAAAERVKAALGLREGGES